MNKQKESNDNKAFLLFIQMENNYSLLNTTVPSNSATKIIFKLYKEASHFL